MKLDKLEQMDLDTLVAPHAGAWIETGLSCCISSSQLVAPHAGAWIETLYL